ncbi:unnamed protein product [Prorocentrum cordatum]|uniref:Uncharacterized protein n=1 Tax=Prorocentrum cordatum TaxID=2364126 RepID=A0ABN9RR09_9DINO|nr:unnamed protein product [Polarella glacialis]
MAAPSGGIENDTNSGAAAECADDLEVRNAAAVELRISVSPVEKLEHLRAFCFPSWRKRPPHPCLDVTADLEHSLLVVEMDGSSHFRGEGEATALEDNGPEALAIAEDAWSKAVDKELKKLVVEDLGKKSGDGGVLLNTAFTEEGMEKLQKHEQEEKVKVVFRGDGHVLLVGAKAKLDKKTVAIRTLVTHFHWRLVGQYQGQSAVDY